MKELSVKSFEKSGVVSFHNQTTIQWNQAREIAPSLPKAWFELSKIQSDVRLEFIRDYWINALPYSSQLYAFLDRFFSGVKEVGIIAAEGNAYLTYELKTAVFLGGIPLKDEQINVFSKRLNVSVPVDYLQFFRIHNGFRKEGDIGVFSSDDLIDEVKKMHSRESHFIWNSEQVDSQDLFPFYYCFDFDRYQCFNKRWIIDKQMGNVCCHLSESAISNVKDQKNGGMSQSFSTFLDWLICYMGNE